MFVIACKWIEDSEILQLIESIKNHQPNETIVVVDSDSENKKYFDDIKDRVIIEDISNKNYLEGALWYCYEKYKDEDFFYLVQDSMILKRNLEELKNFEVTYFTSFPYHYNMQYGNNMKTYCAEIIKQKTKYEYKTPKLAVFGSVVFVKRSFLDKLKLKGFDNVLPKNKMEMESLERIWAIIIEQEGYQMENIILVRSEEFSDNQYFDKFWLGRT
jgi:hypothetical protein